MWVPALSVVMADGFGGKPLRPVSPKRNTMIDA